MSDSDRRFYFIPPDDPSGTRDIICVGLPDIAERFAIELGEGAHIVDTLAAPYYPMVKRVENGEAVYLEFGGWDMVAHPETNLIEAVKKTARPWSAHFSPKAATPTPPTGAAARR